MKTTKKLMKKTVLFTLLALLGMTQMEAQGYEYIPFVREGVKWVCDAPYIEWVEGMGITRHNIFTLELAGDTVIDGKCYLAMHKYSGDTISATNDTIPVFLREENKVVYGIVPNGKTYSLCPVGMNWWPEAREIIENGQEFILYDFNDPINFIKNNIKYPVEGTPYGYYVTLVLTDQLTLAGKKVNCYTYDTACVIEGVGYDGLWSGYPLSPQHNKLCYVIENGDTIYTARSDEDWGIYDELPIPRQGVQWVNEVVTIKDGDTTSLYYKYEFKGYDSQGFALCYHYTGETLDSSPDKSVWAQYQSWEYAVSTSNGMIRKNIPYGRVLSSGRNMMDYGCGMGWGYWMMYHFDNYSTVVDYDYTPNWYISRQKVPFLTLDNLIEVTPLIIEDTKCRRFAYIGEQGDTLAYIVQGIGFDSRDMGDLLTPFTRKPDPDADYQEYCGLSHVIKDGKIIYKGMRYHPNLSGDVNSDGEITIADANNVVDIIVMGDNSTHSRAPQADVNGDGEVNIADVNAIIDIIQSNNQR